MRRAIVSVEVPDRWESWYIELTPEGEADAPEELTSEWLNNNPDAWEMQDLKDAGGWRMQNLELEDEI